MVSSLRLPGSPIYKRLVSAYQLMVRLAPASSWSAFFVLLSPYGLTILSQNTFIAAFGRAISTTGLPYTPADRGHSFSRDTASWAFNRGVPGELIQIYGDCASDLEFGVASKLAFAQQHRLLFSRVLRSSSQFVHSLFFGRSVWWQRGYQAHRKLLFTFRSYP